MSALKELAAKNIEMQAPFYMEVSPFTKGGAVQQNDKIRRLIKKNHSGRASGSGFTVYVLRVTGPGIPFGPVAYLAYNDNTGEVSFNQK